MSVKICVLFFFHHVHIIHSSNLAAQCTALSRPHNYWTNGNCYVVHNETKMYNAAKMSCNDILGYSGHLIHIRSAAVANMTATLMTAASVLHTWIGTESFSNIWYYTTPTKQLNEVATYIAWGSNNGSVATNMIYQSTGTMMKAYNNSYPFICEYEEKYAYTVTAAANYCYSLQTIPNAFFGFVGGSCIYVPYPFLLVQSEAMKRNVCPNITGLASRVAHLDTTDKVNLVYQVGRYFLEQENYPVIDISYFYAGLEQLKSCPGNTCSEEGGYSWFWTTPEGYKWPANVFWGSGYPTADTAGINQSAVLFDSSSGFGDVGSAVAAAASVCEYLEPYSFSNFEKACLLSANPSAVGYSSCFTLVRNATTFAAAQSKCSEFAGGFLARVNTVEMATFLSTGLWANTGLPPSMRLFTGLQQSSANWYWMYPDGTKSLANSSNLPWNASQPQSPGQCASVNQNGLLVATNCTNTQWFICQYYNPIIRGYTGIAEVKGSSRTTISETPTISIAACDLSCRQNGECRSFAYSFSTCQLLTSGFSTDTVPASGYTWFKLTQ